MTDTTCPGKKRNPWEHKCPRLTYPQVQPLNAMPESPRNQQLNWDNECDVIKWKLQFFKNGDYLISSLSTKITLRDETKTAARETTF